jgi:hypothetical protein
MRNKCVDCGEPVGNITFTACDSCWDKKHSRENRESEITMTHSQKTILEVLTLHDTARASVESDGYGETAEVEIHGHIEIKHADLQEMVKRGWIEIDRDGNITALNDGGVALVEAPPASA